MSSPVVERVRTIPLIVEREMPMEAEEITGYPFDRDSDRDRDGYLRSQLDDIAKRHPEIAEHLENFTHRDRQRRRPSTEEAGSPSHFPRQFGNRFERFGFPFDRDDFDPEYYTQFEQPHTQQHSTYQHSQPENPTNQSTFSQSSPNQSCPQTSNPDRCNLQQSSTFDLGQKQEPVNDRGQRSMSAPPSENTPNNQPQQPENMSHSHSETKSSNERIIPIHIEGRDEPVMPKNIPPSYSQQHHASQPQPERLFGKPTEHFTQFLPHERDARFANNWNQGFAAEEPIRQQRFQPQYAAQKKTQEYVPSQPKDIPIPVHREAPAKHPEHSHQQSHQQHQPQNQQQRSASPQAPPEQPKVTPQPKPLTPLDQIQAIQKDVSSLMQQVEAFAGKSKDKQYLYLDEMLTRNLIKLDNIDTQGQESIRSARKEAIKCIEKTIGILEAKAAGGSDIPKESADSKETFDVSEESSQFPKESSEISKEMEVDEKTVEDKVPENTTAGELIEEKNVEVMETEISSSQPSGGVQVSMEVAEVADASAGSVLTSDAVEKKEASPNLESGEKASEQKVSEEKQVENATANKKQTTSEEEMLEDNNPVPDSKAVTENTVTQSEEENVKDQVPENPSTTVDTVNVGETTENESGDKKEKKDKKKGKKKTEKKEK